MPIDEELLASAGYTPAPIIAPAPEGSPMAPKESEGVLGNIQSFGGGLLGSAMQRGGQALQNVGTLVGSDSIKEAAQPAITQGQALQDFYQEKSPWAEKAGTLGEMLGEAALVPGTSIKAIIAGGAALNAATSPADTRKDITANALIGGAISGAVGGVLKGAAVLFDKVMPNILSGATVASMDTNQLAQTSKEILLKKAGGNLANATPEQAVSSLEEVTKGFTDASKKLYAARDLAAQESGLMVEKSNVQSLADSLKSDMLTGVVEGTPEALQATKRILGETGSAVSFKKAQELMSGLGSAISDASNGATPNRVLARQLIGVQTALGKDIDSAAALNPAVQQLHDIATANFKENLVPIRGLDVQQRISHDLTKEQYLSGVVKDLGKSEAVTNGFGKLPDETKANILGVHLQAIQDASTRMGELDPALFAKALDKQIRLHPEIAKQTNTLEDMRTLMQIVSANATAKGQFDKLGSELAITLGFGAVANPMFLGAAVWKQGYHLYAAGKILNNESGQGMLKMMNSLGAYPNSAIYAATAGKIAKLYNNKLLQGTMPYLKKIAPTLSRLAASS